MYIKHKRSFFSFFFSRTREYFMSCVYYTLCVFCMFAMVSYIIGIIHIQFGSGDAGVEVGGNHHSYMGVLVGLLNVTAKCMLCVCTRLLYTDIVVYI